MIEEKCLIMYQTGNNMIQFSLRIEIKLFRLEGYVDIYESDHVEEVLVPSLSTENYYGWIISVFHNHPSPPTLIFSQLHSLYFL